MIWKLPDERETVAGERDINDIFSMRTFLVPSLELNFTFKIKD